MTNSNSDSFDLAKELAPHFTEILQVPDLVDRIQSLEGDQARLLDLGQKDFSLGDAMGMAGLFIGLVQIILQARGGHTFQGTPEDKIKERLILKLSQETKLPATARERLINKLIEKLPPHGDQSE